MEEKKSQHDPRESEKDPGFHNIGKIIFLIVALAAAWFVLEWLMGGK